MTDDELRHRKKPADESPELTNEEPSTEPRSPLAGEEGAAIEPPPGFFSFDFFCLVGATLVIVAAIKYFDLLFVSKPKIFTQEELAAFDGTEGSPLYVAILGEVYDVSKGDKYYGKDSGYHCFVAKDGSRAYVTGQFVDDLTDDVSDFNAEKHGGLVEWRQFYRDHADYAFVGRVIGSFYDERGRATAALKAVEKGALQAEEIKAQREEAKKLNPNCNSRWAQGKGGEVWCNEGYPRLVIEYFPGAEEKKRCACFMDTEHSKNKQLYENCRPDASHCIVPPKEEEKSKDM